MNKYANFSTVFWVVAIGLLGVFVIAAIPSSPGPAVLGSKTAPTIQPTRAMYPDVLKLHLHASTLIDASADPETLASTAETLAQEANADSLRATSVGAPTTLVACLQKVASLATTTSTKATGAAAEVRGDIGLTLAAVDACLEQVDPAAPTQEITHATTTTAAASKPESQIK